MEMLSENIVDSTDLTKQRDRNKGILKVSHMEKPAMVKTNAKQPDPISDPEISPQRKPKLNVRN